MARGKYPRYDGTSLASEAFSDPDILREMPELKEIVLPKLLQRVTLDVLFSQAAGRRHIMATLKLDHEQVWELIERFWDLGDLNDRHNPHSPQSYEEAQYRRELDGIVKDLEQVTLFGVYRPDEEITTKRARARFLHNELRALKGLPPKPPSRVAEEDTI